VGEANLFKRQTLILTHGSDALVEAAGPFRLNKKSPIKIGQNDTMLCFFGAPEPEE